MLVLKNINKSFNDIKVLKNLNIEFKSGLNFILGPSGSGKSTLLKIMSGLDKDYDGQVSYNGNSLKNFSEKELNSYYYNSVGFIWQDFQLIDYLTVEENVNIVLELSPLSNEEKKEKVSKMLESLAIHKLAKTKVSKLSGGQKQRVAIARALIKDPEIIIADEPTGALDRKASNLIISVLKKVAKNKIVIVVTHDNALIDDESSAFLLKDGAITQLSSSSKEQSVAPKLSLIKPTLSLGNALKQGGRNFKGLSMKFISTAMVLMMSSYFLLLNLTGTAVNEQQDILNNLIKEKGNIIKDISVVSNAISGSSTDSNNKGSKPNVNIEQDVTSSLEKYKDDERIDFLFPVHAVDNMSITIDGVTKNHKLNSSNSIPYVNKVIEGRMPNQEGKEVALSNLVIKNLKLAPKDVIGKKISITGEGFDWSSGQPKAIPIKIDNLTIVGILDTTVSTQTPNGKKFEYELEDSFAYGLDVVKEFKKQSNSSAKNISFTMRVKNIEDLMSIVDELSKDGITALGEFESVKDILKINSTTKDQSNSITIIIAVIAVIATIAVTLINSYLRKKDVAILKINGYSKGSLLKLNIAETLIMACISMGAFSVLYPLINKLSDKVFNMTLANSNSLVLGLTIILIQALVIAILSWIINLKVNIKNSLMSGDN